MNDDALVNMTKMITMGLRLETYSPERGRVIVRVFGTGEFERPTLVEATNAAFNYINDSARHLIKLADTESAVLHSVPRSRSGRVR